MHAHAGALMTIEHCNAGTWTMCGPREKDSDL
jgi:hypothetical protein